MITAFRKKLGVVLLWGIIAVVTAGLLVYLVPSYMGNGAGASGRVGGGFVVATVGSDQITYDEFSRRYALLMSVYRRQLGGQVEDEKIAELLRVKDQAIEHLVLQRILLQRARVLGIRVTPEELAAEIKGDPTFARGGGFSKEVYLAVLRQNRMTPEVYEAIYERELILRKLEELVKGSAKLSEDELRHGYNVQKQQLTVEYVELADPAVAKELADKITVALGEGKDLKAAAQAAGVAARTVTVGGAAGARPEGVKDAEALLQAARAQKVGPVGALVQGGAAAYLLRVVDRKLPGDAEFEKDKAAFRRQALELKRNQVFQDYVREARRATNIHIDRQALGG